MINLEETYNTVCYSLSTLTVADVVSGILVASGFGVAIYSLVALANLKKGIRRETDSKNLEKKL